MFTQKFAGNQIPFLRCWAILVSYCGALHHEPSCHIFMNSAMVKSNFLEVLGLQTTPCKKNGWNLTQSLVHTLHVWLIKQPPLNVTPPPEMFKRPLCNHQVGGTSHPFTGLKGVKYSQYQP